MKPFSTTTATLTSLSPGNNAFSTCVTRQASSSLASPVYPVFRATTLNALSTVRQPIPSYVLSARSVLWNASLPLNLPNTDSTPGSMTASVPTPHDARSSSTRTEPKKSSTSTMDIMQPTTLPSTSHSRKGNMISRRWEECRPGWEIQLRRNQNKEISLIDSTQTNMGAAWKKRGSGDNHVCGSVYNSGKNKPLDVQLESLRQSHYQTLTRLLMIGVEMRVIRRWGLDSPFMEESERTDILHAIEKNRKAQRTQHNQRPNSRKE